jgi:hypothetical protein
MDPGLDADAAFLRPAGGVAAPLGEAAPPTPAFLPCRLQVSEEVLEWTIANVHREGDEVRWLWCG